MTDHCHSERDIPGMSTAQHVSGGRRYGSGQGRSGPHGRRVAVGRGHRGPWASCRGRGLDIAVSGDMDMSWQTLAVTVTVNLLTSY